MRILNALRAVHMNIYKYTPTTTQQAPSPLAALAIVLQLLYFSLVFLAIKKINALHTGTSPGRTRHHDAPLFFLHKVVEM